MRGSVPRLVSLDFTGVMAKCNVAVAYRRAAADAIGGVAAARLEKVDNATLVESFGLAFRTQLKQSVTFGGVKDDAQRRWWDAVIDETWSRSGVVLDAAEAARVREQTFHRFATAEFWSVFDDTRPLLAAAAARGVPVAVVSNFDGRLPGILDALGLADGLAAVVFASQYEREAKPNRVLFDDMLAASGAAHLPREDVWHVGDSFAADVCGAAQAGLQPVWLQRGGIRADDVVADHGGALETVRIASLASITARLAASPP